MKKHIVSWMMASLLMGCSSMSPQAENSYEGYNAAPIERGTASAERECRNYAGQTACGYNCVAYAGQLKCAETPAGACLGYSGQVKCDDPDRFRPGMPQMKCEGYSGQIDCGYDCVTYSGQVKCAKTPYGACYAYSGQVKCADPKRIWTGMPKMECKGYSGQIDCGYSCVTYSGQVRCSKYPDGICKAYAGKITCSDDTENNDRHQRGPRG